MEQTTTVVLYSYRILFCILNMYKNFIIYYKIAKIDNKKRQERKKKIVFDGESRTVGYSPKSNHQTSNKRKASSLFYYQPKMFHYNHSILVVNTQPCVIAENVFLFFT